jgi:hypothetical protein
MSLIRGCFICCALICVFAPHSDAQGIEEGSAYGQVVEIVGSSNVEVPYATVSAISNDELARVKGNASEARAWRNAQTVEHGRFSFSGLRAGDWFFYAFASREFEGNCSRAGIHAKEPKREVSPDPIKLQQMLPPNQGQPSRGPVKDCRDTLSNPNRLKRISAPNQSQASPRNNSALRRQGAGRIILVLERMAGARTQQQPAPPPKLEATIVDERGEPLPDAIVSLYAQEQDTVVRVGLSFTDAQGEYHLDLSKLPESPEYLLTVAKFGYEARVFIVRDLTSPELLKPVGLDPESDFGAIAGMGAADASRRRVFTSAPGRTLEAVPLPGSRSLDSLALTLAGILPPPETRDNHGPSFSPGIGTAGAFTVNGLRGRDVTFTVDGGDNNDELTGTRREGFIFSSSLVPEAVREFQVVSAFPDVRLGRGISGQVDIISKTDLGGSHVSVYNLFTDDGLKARDFFESAKDATPGGSPVLRPSDGTPVLLDGRPLFAGSPPAGKPEWTHTQPGVLLGGPIHHVYFTSGIEGQIQRGSQEMHFSVPTVNERQLPPEVLATLPDGSFPVTVPGDAVFSYYPFPNNPKGPFGVHTYTALLPVDGSGARWFAKLQETMPRSGEVGARAGFKYSHSIESSALPSSAGGINSMLNARIQNIDFVEYGGIETLSSAHDFRLAIGATVANLAPHAPSSGLQVAPLLLDVTPVTSGAVVANEQYVTAASPAGSALLSGLGYSNVPHAENILGPFGQLALAGYSPVGIDPFFFPQRRVNITGQVAYAGSLTRGQKVYLFGAEVGPRGIDTENDPNVLPQIMFSGLRSVFPSGGALADASSASLAAAGLPTGVFQTFSDFRSGYKYKDDRGLRYYLESLYFQHERPIKPSLRLIAGLRMELRNISDYYKQSLASNFNRKRLLSDAGTAEANCFLPCPGLAFAIGQAFPANYPDLAITRVAFGPRIGIAWNPFGTQNWAVRAGYGVYPGTVSGFAANDIRQAFNQFIPLNLANSPLFTPQGEFLLNLANRLVRQLRPDLNIVPSNAVSFSQISVNPLQLLTQSLTNLSAFGTPPTFSALTLSGTPQKLANPYAEHYAITVERELKNAAFSLAYVGTRGINLIRPETSQGGALRSFMTIDQISTAAGGFPTISATSKPPQRTLAGGIVAIAPTIYSSSASSSFNSLQADFSGHFRGIQVSSSYTYSHAIDDVSDLFNLSGAFALPQDSYRPSERASSNFDVRHRFSGTFIWDIAQHESSQWFSGWQLAGIWTVQSGQPFTVNSAFDINRDGNLTDRLQTMQGIEVGLVSNDSTSLIRIGPSIAIRNLLAAAGTDGSVGRNTFRSWGVRTADAAVTKVVNLRRSEERLTFRLECFNVLNHPQFAIPVRILESPSFGRAVQTTIPARTFQLVVKWLY